MKTGQRDLALNDFDVCIERGNPNIEVYIQADRLLMQSRDWTRIIANWTAFIGRNPESGRAFYERGGAHHRNGDAPSALRDLEESCRLGYQQGCQVLRRFSRPSPADPPTTDPPVREPIGTRVSLLQSSLRSSTVGTRKSELRGGRTAISTGFFSCGIHS